jgi:deoxyribonuclease (pyrimidine dimer)
MVRINIINPKKLADQHLLAEYNEILMLFGYVKKHPKKYKIDHDYCLGKGHVIFFKDKLLYLKKRHELIKKEMHRRGFKRNKTIDLDEFPKDLRKDWRPKTRDLLLIKRRLREKINLKPEYYRYEGEKRKKKFFLNLLK